MITQFLHHLYTVRNYSPRTVDDYQHVLGKYSEFLASCHKSFSDATIHELREFVCSEMARGLSARTLNQNVSALRSFYKYLRAYHNFQNDPTASWQPIKQAKKLPLFINIDKINELLDVSLPRKTWQQRRAWFCVLFLFSTGVRAQEMCEIRVRDIDMQARTLLVMGKGRKERRLPFGAELAQAISEHVAENNLTSDDPLIISNKREQLEPWQLRQILQHSMGKFLPHEYCRPHVLRHSFATALINNNAPIQVVQKLLGHDSIETTQIYTHVAFAPMQQCYNVCFQR